MNSYLSGFASQIDAFVAFRKASNLWNEESYGKNIENVQLASNKIKLDVIGERYRPTFINTEYKASIKSNGEVSISAESAVKGFKPFEVKFKVDKEVKSALIDEDE